MVRLTAICEGLSGKKFDIDDGLAESPKIVIPAKAGIHNTLNVLDAGSSPA